MRQVQMKLPKRALSLALCMLLMLSFINVMHPLNAEAANPYLPLWEHIPDGEPYVFEDPDNPGEYRLYVYGSHDTRKTGYCGYDIPVWSAPVDNLNNWRYDGPCFESVVNGAYDALYAPDVEVVVAQDGTKTYYMYPNNQASGRTSMATKSDRPDGPFEVINWTDETKTRTTGTMGFDPAVFVDYNEDGSIKGVYGYWGINSASMAELDPNTMYSLKSGTSSRGTFSQSPTDNYNFFEASSLRMIEMNGFKRYVFIYSRHNVDGEYGLARNNSTLGYAYSDHPMGPWKLGGTVVDSRAPAIGENGAMIPTQVWGNTHGSMVEVNGQWYIFYHRRINRDEYSRQAMADPINVSITDGGDVVITGANDPIKDINGKEYTGAEVTSQGFELNGLDPYRYHSAGIACYFNPTDSAIASYNANAPYIKASYDIWADDAPVVNIRNNAVVGYKYFNFDKTPDDAQGTALEIYLTPKGSGFTVDIMMDSPWAGDGIGKGGTKIGELSVSSEAAREKAKFVVPVPALDGVDGKHGIYFVFRSATTGAEVCELNGFGFSSPGKVLAAPTVPALSISADGNPVTLPAAPTNATAANGITDYSRYDAVYMYSGTTIPVITASSGDDSVKIGVTQAESSNDTAVVKFDYNGVVKNYSIKLTSDYVPPSAEAGSANYGSPAGIDDAIWATANPLGIHKDSQGTDFAHGDAKVLWDEDNLYVRVDVIDPVLDGSNEDPWLQDSVEVYLSESAVKGSYSSSEGNQFRVTFQGAYSRKSNTTQASNVKYDAKIIEGGYAAYLAIPLTQAASENKIVTFDVQINNASGGSRAGVSTWSDPFGDGYNTSLYWGDLTLTKTGIKVWYKFDETSGTVVHDSSGSGYHATVMGGALFNEDGSGINLDNSSGQTKYVNLPKNIFENVSGDFTVSTWVYFRSGSNWSRLFDFGPGSSANIMFLTANTLQFNMDNANARTAPSASNNTNNPNVWRLVTITHQGNTTTMYTDGARVAGGSQPAAAERVNSSYNYYIGRSNWSADPYPNMMVRDFRIYNRALSASEVEDLYNSYDVTDVTLGSDGKTATAVLVNDSDSDKTLKVLLASYTSDGRMAEVVMSSDIVVPAQGYVSDVTLSLKGDTSDKTVKAFIWDDQYIPYTEPWLLKN